MNQKNKVYLYYSTNKLECTASDVSSLLGVINTETNLVISPKQEIGKKREKKKKKEKTDFNKKISPGLSPSNNLNKSLSPSHSHSHSPSPLMNKYFSLDKGRKSPINKVKVFKESSLDEPFMLDSKASVENNSKDKEGFDYELLSTQKSTFEEVNSEVKKRYKSYDKDDEYVDKMPLYNYRPPQETCCEWLGRVIAETRRPSEVLSLSILIQEVITEKMLQGIIDTNSNVKMEKMALEKYSLIQFRNNLHSIEFKDKEVQELFRRAQIQTIQRFNCETISVSLSLLIILIGIYLVSIYTFLK